MIAVLVGTMAVTPVSAQTIVSTPVEMQPIKISPIAYTSDFDAYSNVVGVLNSDGTKTAYIFASPADAAQVDSITGLVSPVEQPSVEANAGASQNLVPVEDATVYSDTPNVNYGNEQQLYFGEHETRGYARTYMKFNLSALSNLSYKNVLSAHLCIQQSRVAYEPLAILEAYLAKGAWNENAITWNNRPDYYEEVLGRATLENLTGNLSVDIERRTCEFYITEAVMGWLQGLTNNGLLIKEIEDEFNNAFYSSEYNSDKRPYLKITYTNDEVPSGLGIYSGSRSYYIVNRSQGTCLTAISAIEGADVQQAWGSTSTDALQKWQFTKMEDGRYLIKLAGNSVCLSNSSRVSVGDVCLGDGTQIDNNLWQVERNWNGTYRFFNDCSSYDYLYSGIYGGGLANIYQYNYSCDFNFQDEWTLVPANQGTAYFYGFTEEATNLDTTYGFTVIGSRFDSYLKQLRTNKNATNGFNALKSGDLFYFSGHGINNQLYFYEPRSGEVENESYISTTGTTNALSSLEPNALARQRLVFLSSCYSGGTLADEADNMSGYLYQLGTHNVISYHRTTSGGTIDERGPDSVWNSVFLTTLMNGRTLGEAKERADGYLRWNYVKDTPDDAQRPYGNLLDRHDLGDDSYRTCFDMKTQATVKIYPYSTNFEYTHSTVYGRGNVSVALNGMPSITIIKKYTLPINHQQETFDVYVDSLGATYWYYAGTDVLHLFEPYTGNLELGKTVVNPAAAMAVVTNFLQEKGYDTTGFVCETSNEYSKNFTVQYTYLTSNTYEQDEQLIFHLQSDLQGNVYIKDFTAHHYGEESQEG